MKNVFSLLTACMLMMLALTTGAYAQGDSNNTVVTIGDGAPIPYLEGFESRLVRNADTIAGIAGAFTDVEVHAASDLQSWSGTWRYTLENLVLTDDVLGVFFRQTYSEPIPYDGKTPFHYSLMARISILVNGEELSALTRFREGYPIDANSQCSFALYALPQPIADGQTLTFGAVWNNDSQAWEGGASVTVDRSQANDPTVAYEPGLSIQTTMALWEGSPAVAYDFTIERVAFTPFGSRILLGFRGTCENNQYLEYQLLDDNGAMLNIVPPMQRFQSNASAEHPVWNENELWFFGGENSKSLTLVPTGGNWQTSNKAQRTAWVRLDSLPADVELENGVMLHVEDCALDDNGFYTRYSTDGYAGSVGFDLGDEAGSSLGFAIASYRLEDHSLRLLGYGGYWSEEYKGQTVSRVTQEQLSQVSTLLIEYSVGFPKLIENEAIEVDLLQ